MKHKIKRIALAIMCVIVCASITLTMCFADSIVNSSTAIRVEVDNAPYSMLIYRSLGGRIIPMECGNPFVYADGVIPETDNVWLGYSDYLATTNPLQSGNSNLQIRTSYSYVNELNHDFDIITSVFETSGNTYALNDGGFYALAFQLYYRNCYFYDEVNPTIEFYLDSDYTDIVKANVSYRYYGKNGDGNLALFTTTKEVPLTVRVESGSYIHTLNFTDIFSHVQYNDGYPINDGEALIEQMYVDINFSAEDAYYSNNYGVRFNHSRHGVSDISFDEKLRELANYEANETDKPLAEWAFDAIENIVDYPLFYVGDVRVTPIAIFSLVFGLGLFSWLLKVFAGG